MAPDSDGIDNRVNRERRDFLRTLITGAAFAPPLIASFSLDGLSLAAADVGFSNQCAFSNQCGGFPEFSFDFSGSQYADNFQDILRGAEINSGPDLGGGGHPALNFTGSAGAGGSTWLTVLNQNVYGEELCLAADILIHRYNNAKGAGLLALFNVGADKKGLALLIINAGNSDSLQLGTVDQVGKFVKLKSVPLGGGIAENAWYALSMRIVLGSPAISTIVASDISVEGKVFRHSTPGDPDSDCPTQVGATLLYSAPLPSGVDPSGDVGLVARATSAVVDSSVTNFTGTAEFTVIC